MVTHLSLLKRTSGHSCRALDHEYSYSEAQADLLFGNERLMELARSVTAAAVDFGPNGTLMKVVTLHV